MIGILGTLVGVGLGFLAIGWLVNRSSATIPELQMLTTMKPATM